MPARVRAFDWEATPLGGPAAWPPSLRAALSLCLSSRFPLIVWWGPELRMLYNDAYIPFLGASKHPAALGQPGQAVWSEIWHRIGPMLDSVLRTGQATWSDDAQFFFDRELPREEVYVTFTYGPVLAQDGHTVEGVFCPCTETTEKIVNARRLDTLGKLGSRTLQMRSIEAASEKVCAVLQESRHDVAFALIYRLCAQGQTFDLLASCGLEARQAGAPAPWPLAQVAQVAHSREAVQVDLAALGLALPGGPWPEPAMAAHLEPLYWGGDGTVSGVMVLGVSPRRPLDAAYRAFLHLVASHTGSALANAVAHEQQRRRAEALAEVDRAKTAFFSNVSHEFRTPLTLMLGPIEDAIHGQDAALAPDRLHMLHRNALRLQKLVNNLLDFSSIEAGRMRARYEPTDLAQATCDLAGVFRSAIEAAGLQLRVQCDRLDAPVHVDREMYEKIVLNLLSNAFKFTLRGHIAVTLHDAGDAVQLRVQDTGVGIAAQHMPRLFERFHRIEGQPARTHEGSGIGLALVKELARLHGGEVQAASAEGQGSCFTVRLPKGTAHLPAERLGEPGARPGEALSARHYLDEALRWLPGPPSVAGPGAGPGTGPAAGPAAPAPAGPAGPAGTAEAAEAAEAVDTQAGARALVLCADDNADMREYLSQLLAPLYEVQAVPDGQSALASIARRLPDLVLTDAMMPALDGFGLLQALRADERTQAIPVIMISARAGQEARVEGLGAGADDYLVKPFPARELLARVEAHLRLARVRAQAHAALSAHEKRLRTIIEQLPAAVGVCDMDGTMVLSNAAMDRFVPQAIPSTLATRRQRWRGSDEHGQPIAPQDWPGKRALRGEMVVPGLEMLYTDDDGQDWWMRVSASPLRDDQGQVVGACMVIQDMTRLKQAEHELRDADRRKDEFLATLAHELRNPLAPISNGLQVLRRMGGHAEEARRNHEMMERQVSHMVRLVDDLLEISRITTGKIQLRRAPVELAPLLGAAVEACRFAMHDAGHDLRIELPGEPLWLHADAVRLTQVVSNLLHNAAKYTDAGGHVRLAAWREGASAVVSVSDDGIGMPAAMLDKVFDLFTQLDHAGLRAQGGLGLGLTLVRSLVEMHGGSVRAHSEGAGLGSEFVVRLPLAPASPRAPEPAAAHDEGAETALGRILVVDDNEDAAHTLATVLRLLGAQVQTAHDGPAALLACAAGRPDVVLLDIGLPGMDGLQVARTLRADTALAQPVLIALTGWGQEQDLRRSRAAGMDHHLVKPVDIDALERLLARLASERRSAAP